MLSSCVNTTEEQEILDFSPLGSSQAQEAFYATELLGNNPWLDYTGHIEVLPIFANPIQWNMEQSRFKTPFTSDAELAEIITDAALAMGWTAPIKEIEFEEFGVGHIIVNGWIDESTRIELWSTRLALRFIFEEGLPLGNGIYDSNREEAEETIQYLITRFSNILDMKKPTLSITQHYNFAGDKQIVHSVFDAGSGDIVDAILGYNFSTINFMASLDEYGQSKGTLWIIDVNLPRLHLSQPLGEYPIITSDEARALLLEGFYISTITEMHWPGEKYALVELVYRVGMHYDTIMPYYLFRIEIPEYISGRQMGEAWPTRPEELKTFGYWWVPAIQREYLPYPQLRPVMFN